MFTSNKHKYFHVLSGDGTIERRERKKSVNWTDVFTVVFSSSPLSILSVSPSFVGAKRAR